MKITYEEFEEMRLKPAFYNGEEFDTTVEFNDSGLSRVAVCETDLLLAKPGDTVRIGGRIVFEDCAETSEPVVIFMDANRLTEFIEKYGTGKINGRVDMKLMLRHAVYRNKSDPTCRREVVAFRLIELY